MAERGEQLGSNGGGQVGGDSEAVKAEAEEQVTGSLVCMSVSHKPFSCPGKIPLFVLK